MPILVQLLQQRGGPLQELVNVAVAHQWAPFEAIGSLETEVDRAYEQLSRHADEIVVLATCNRFEVYAIADDELVDAALRFLEERGYAGYARVFRGIEAARRLLRIASGLESAVLGETEILGQVSSAYQRALEMGYAGKKLSLLFQYAVRTGKRVRSETRISYGHVGAPGAAVHAVEKSIGGLEGKAVVVVGAGEAGAAIARLVRSQAPRARIIIVNRTLERAAKLAAEVGGEAAPLDDDSLARALSEADAVFIAVSSAEPVIRKRHLERVQRRIMIADISNIPAVEMPLPPNVAYIGLSGIEGYVREVIELRRAEVPKAERIVEESLEKLVRVWTGRAADHAIAKLMAYAEAVYRGEVEELLSALGVRESDGARARSVAEAFARSLASKLLRPVILHLREAALNGDMELLEALARIVEQELEKLERARAARHPAAERS
jgi:glutamyl-tRNA reductase